MKRAKRWLFLAATLLLLSVLGTTDAALPFKKVSIAKTLASTTTTSTTTTISTDTADAEEEDEAPEQATAEGDETKADNITQSKNSKLTGIPQIDYIWDPNLPRELHGYNLSSYPFLSTVPTANDIHFKCEGLHDGFYASIEYKCQVYHHCVYGIRHDFLCANFTAFDQRTFICHFASDVDCEGSQKYWNRNDELYMATTTTSTSTTTTEPPPPTPRRRPMRPQRPLRRPYNRRPIDDYYYDDEEYEDDYYEERLNRRHKPRSRQRKPAAVDYDDEYDDKIRDEEKPRRNAGRNRYRDDDEPDQDYDDRRSRPRTRAGLSKSTPTASGAERRKAGGRKPGKVEERRSFNDERPRKDKVKPLMDDDGEELPNARRAIGRRRSNDKEALDDLDEFAADQEEAAEEEVPQKVKTTPKPLEEFVTPKAVSSSVYARPRAPPRIARPVPNNEKKKYQYPVQKSTATTQSPAASADSEDDDYYQQQEDDYEQARLPARNDNAARRRTASSNNAAEPAAKRRNNQKPTRPTLRKTVTDKKSLLEGDDYEEGKLFEKRRKRPLTASRTRTAAPDLDFVDDDYEEQPAPRRNAPQRLRTKSPLQRKPRPRQPIAEDEELTAPGSDDEAVTERVAPVRNRGNTLLRRNNKPALNSRQRALPTPKTTPEPEPEAEVEDEQLPELEKQQEEEPLAPAAPSKTLTAAGRTASVRVVKRPFLPSRGGSPYLPRGLQPVGVALKPLHDTRTTDSTPIDMGSTISGVRLLEHGAPLLRDSGSDEDFDEPPLPSPLPPKPTPPRTTLPPRSALPTASTQKHPDPQPKVNLDELYENDYDVTLNDALDPTLKPLTPQHLHQHQSYSRPYSNIRRRAIVPSQGARPSRHEYSAAGAVSQVNARLAQHFYDDFTY